MSGANHWAAWELTDEKLRKILDGLEPEVVDMEAAEEEARDDLAAGRVRRLADVVADLEERGL